MAASTSQPTALERDAGDSRQLRANNHSWGQIALRTLVVLAIVAIVAAIYFFVLEPYLVEVEAFIDRLGPWGPVAFIVVFLIATALFVPESILAIAGGTLFGLWWGWAWVVVAGLLAAALMFFLGRVMLRAPVTRRLSKYPKLNAIDQALGRSGFKILILLRLAPVSYTLLNYMAAVSPCRFRSYMLATIGMIPGNFSTVYMGYVARHTSSLARQLKDDHQHLQHGDTLIHEITIYAGLVAAILASAFVARVAVRAIHRETGAQQDQAAGAVSER